MNPKETTIDPIPPKVSEIRGFLWISKIEIMQQRYPSKLVTKIATRKILFGECWPQERKPMLAAVDWTVTMMDIFASLDMVDLQFLSTSPPPPPSSMLPRPPLPSPPPPSPSPSLLPLLPPLSSALSSPWPSPQPPPSPPLSLSPSLLSTLNPTPPKLPSTLLSGTTTL
ncbi:pistil-specific extensin-like protein [Quercus suber]|uniref:pistil-specific extensin-like protein n=1 Tax=Quercus suber TaxID=58331 RepID=UPI000CE1C907|nr:pistil-specific extensin-like protein [Quercus suber]